jgi:hypothetical protein
MGKGRVESGKYDYILQVIYKAKTHTIAPTIVTVNGEPRNLEASFSRRIRDNAVGLLVEEDVSDIDEEEAEVSEAEVDSVDEEAVLRLWPEVGVVKPPPMGRVSVELMAVAADEADRTLARNHSDEI